MGMNEVERDFCQQFTRQIFECPLSFEFRYPIDPEAAWAPDYFRIISRPLDLSTILSNLKLQKYNSTSEWCQDMNTVWQNAMTFNRKPALLYFVADFLQKRCEKVFNKIPRMDVDLIMLRLDKLHDRMKKLLMFEVPPQSLVPRTPLENVFASE
jgi:hypothetical protein